QPAPRADLPSFPTRLSSDLRDPLNPQRRVPLMPDPLFARVGAAPPRRQGRPSPVWANGGKVRGVAHEGRHAEPPILVTTGQQIRRESLLLARWLLGIERMAFRDDFWGRLDVVNVDDARPPDEGEKITEIPVRKFRGMG